MQFDVFPLEPPLTGYIESVFHFKHFNPDHELERVVPTGHVFLLFALDGMVRHTYDSESLEVNANFENVWVSGPHKNHLTISAHPDSQMLVVQFKPFGGYPFFKTPLDTLSGRVIAAEDVFGKDILLLHKRLLEIEPVEGKFTIVRDWLTKQIETDLTADKKLIKLVEVMQKQAVSEHALIIQGYQHTQKHLIEQFKKYIGLTPKTYHRICRFQDILQRINSGKNVVWSDVAYQCGYTDQSHFIKEFTLFSGFSPKKYIQQGYDEGEANFFPIERD